MKELQHLNQYLSKYKRYIFLGILFVIISTIFQIIPAQLVRHSIDLVTENIRVYRSFEGLSLQDSFFHVFAYGILLIAGLIFWTFKVVNFQNESWAVANGDVGFRYWLSVPFVWLKVSAFLSYGIFYLSRKIKNS